MAAPAAPARGVAPTCAYLERPSPAPRPPGACPVSPGHWPPRATRTWPAQARRERDQDPPHAERGCRFWPDPQWLAAALALQKPERSRALLMVRPVCWRVEATVESRIRPRLRPPRPPSPRHQGTAVHIRRPAESSRTWAASRCGVSLGREPWGCMGRTRTRHGYGGSGAPMPHGMHEDGRGLCGMSVTD
jgi:hypothetical protein